MRFSEWNRKRCLKLASKCNSYNGALYQEIEQYKKKKKNWRRNLSDVNLRCSRMKQRDKLQVCVSIRRREGIARMYNALKACTSRASSAVSL